MFGDHGRRVGLPRIAGGVVHGEQGILKDAPGVGEIPPVLLLASDFLKPFDGIGMQLEGDGEPLIFGIHHGHEYNLGIAFPQASSYTLSHEQLTQVVLGWSRAAGRRKPLPVQHHPQGWFWLRVLEAHQEESR